MHIDLCTFVEHFLVRRLDTSVRELGICDAKCQHGVPLQLDYPARILRAAGTCYIPI